MPIRGIVKTACMIGVAAETSEEGNPPSQPCFIRMRFLAGARLWEQFGKRQLLCHDVMTQTEASSLDD